MNIKQAQRLFIKVSNREQRIKAITTFIHKWDPKLIAKENQATNSPDERRFGVILFRI